MTNRAKARRWRLVRARRTAVPASVRRFAMRARHRRLRTALPWLVALAVLAVGGAGAGLVYLTGVFGVAHVQVVGAGSVTSPDEVRHAAAIRPGTPLVRVDLARVAGRVQGLAPVRRATVTRSWPRTVVIRVVERTPVAVVPVAGGGYRAIDEGGVPFQTLPERPPTLPVVQLAAPAPDDPTTRAALVVLRSLTTPLRAVLVRIVAEAPTRIRLEMTGGRTVVWGDATENEAKAKVATALLAGTGKVIDVSAPGVVTVH